jgi:pantothenate kinase-related protein Tda10
MEERIKFIDFKTAFETHREHVLEIKYEELIFLWVGDYYDGKLDGILKYKNQKYKFEIITDYTKAIYPRIFALIILTADEMKEEDYWNEQFEKYVGNHYNYNTTDERIIKPPSAHHLFYDAFNKRKNKNYNNNTVKAWYME